MQDAYNQLEKRFWYKLDSRRERLPYNDAQALAEKYVSTWDIPINSSVSELTTEIKASPEKLKIYISQLMQLESNIYAMTKRLASLYCNLIPLKRTAVYEESLLLRTRLSELSNAEARLEEALNAKVEIPTITYPVQPIAPELKKPGFFNKAKILATNEEMTARYQKEIEIYNEKIALCKKEEERAKEEAATKIANDIEKAKLAVQEAKDALEGTREKDLSNTSSKKLLISIENEASQVESMLKESLECRNKLYSYGIVFEKYRNMITIFTFYEYLASGRCDSLEGANGAYNIYENEVRANVIIDKLSTIIEKLDEIKQNQYMIYSELKKANQKMAELDGKLSKVVNSLETIEYNTEITAYNTAVTAYYAQKNAELTNALGYLIAFK